MVRVHSRVNPNGFFSEAILKTKNQGNIPLIADIKPVSPRDGNLLGHRDPVALAQSLVQGGACALSVVTEADNFGGSLSLLSNITQTLNFPVLRKDFFSTLKQLNESKEAGAAAVLLTVATIPEAILSSLYLRVRELGMEAVVEIHTREELEWALALYPTIIGINNRDILALEKDKGDVRVTEELAPLVPDSIITISESSLLTSEDIHRALAAGADAVLVGTAILQAIDPVSRLNELLYPKPDKPEPKRS